MTLLTEITRAIDPELRSDKSDEYLDFYEELLGEYVDRPFNLLEVGVFKGGSTLLFARKFPHARILGIDVEDPPAAFHDELAASASCTTQSTTGSAPSRSTSSSTTPPISTT